LNITTAIKVIGTTVCNSADRKVETLADSAVATVVHNKATAISYSHYSNSTVMMMLSTTTESTTADCKTVSTITTTICVWERTHLIRKSVKLLTVDIADHHA
jgi:hypothetical protein